MKYIVQEGDISLLNFLKEAIEAPSVKAIKRALDGRACMVNGQTERFGSRRLKKNDVVEFVGRPEESRAKQPILKLYEDGHLLVIDKPVGAVCEDAAIRQLMPEYGRRLWLAHRLDKETSGVLLLARSLEAKESLRRLFAERKMEKVYLAVVQGVPLHEGGVIDSILVVKSRFAGQTIYGSVAQGNGDRAITRWKLLENRKSSSLIDCRPFTGRTHQIRVHLSSIGHPILGDLQYSNRKNEKGVQRCLLHAYQLKFIHPITGESMLFEATIPKEILCGVSC